jgi:hypothetical protein
MVILDKFNNRYYNMYIQKWRVKKIRYLGGENWKKETGK